MWRGPTHASATLASHLITTKNAAYEQDTTEADQQLFLKILISFSVYVLMWFLSVVPSIVQNPFSRSSLRTLEGLGRGYHPPPLPKAAWWANVPRLRTNMLHFKLWSIGNIFIHFCNGNCWLLVGSLFCLFGQFKNVYILRFTSNHLAYLTVFVCFVETQAVTWSHMNLSLHAYLRSP